MVQRKAWLLLSLLATLSLTFVAFTLPSPVYATTYTLSVTVERADATYLTGATVYVDNATYYSATAASSGACACYANKTGITGTVKVAVKWESEWVYGNHSVVMGSSNQALTAVVNVYSITPAFLTSAGAALHSVITSYKLTPAGLNTTTTGALSNGVAYKFQNGTTTISAITWEGTDVTPTVATFDPSTLTPSFNLKVYSVTPTWDTSAGAAVTTAITSYTATMSAGSNSTAKAGLVAGAYQFQTGTVTLSAILWEGSNVTPNASVTFSPQTTAAPVVELNVTALTITFLDVGGNALNAPVSSYSLRSPNSTTNTGLSALSYPQVQFGTYTISVIYYGGNDVTPTASLTKSVTSSSSWTIDLAVSIGPGSGGGSGGGNNPIVTVQPVHTAPYLPPTKQQTPAASLESIEQSLQAPIFGIPAWIMLAAVILVLVYYKKK